MDEQLARLQRDARADPQNPATQQLIKNNVLRLGSTELYIEELRRALPKDQVMVYTQYGNRFAGISRGPWFDIVETIIKKMDDIESVDLRSKALCHGYTLGKFFVAIVGKTFINVWPENMLDGPFRDFILELCDVDESEILNLSPYHKG